MPRVWGYLKDAEGPQQVGQLLRVELVGVGALQNVAREGWKHLRHLVQKGGVCPQDVGDVLQRQILQCQHIPSG